MIARIFTFTSFFFAWLASGVRRVAWWAVPLAVVALAACCPQSLDDEIYLISEPDPSLQPLIDACRDQVRPDCLPLCRALSQSSRYGVIRHCELHQDRSGYVQVHVGVSEELACE